MKRPLLILTGPTAVGKTALSLKLAKAVGGEIISADSMQVYKGMNVGTAKLLKEQRQGIPHYLIDELEPSEAFNVFRFKEMALSCMERVYAKGHVPVLVGGTGFYIQAVLYDIHFEETDTDGDLRRELSRLLEEKGAEYLYQELLKADPASAAAIHPNNSKKVIRALEYHRLTGGSMKEHNDEERKRTSPYRFCYFVLNDERSRLYERIEQRVDGMLSQGLVEEVKRLKEAGCTRELTSMQGLGYKEIYAYLEGECTLSEAVSRIKRDTRHFAKRQLTWFRREKEVIWLNKPDYGYDDKRILDKMREEIKKRGVLP